MSSTSPAPLNISAAASAAAAPGVSSGLSRLARADDDNKTTRRSGATSRNNSKIKTSTMTAPDNANSPESTGLSLNLSSKKHRFDRKHVVGLGDGARKLSHDMKLSGVTHNANNTSTAIRPKNTNKNNNNNNNNSNRNGILFRDREEWIRIKADKCILSNFFKTNMATILIFFFYLITLETILSCMLTVGLTLFWYFYVSLRQEGGGGVHSSADWSGGGIDWVVLGFAVVTPITVSIGMAFRRRELALFQITRFRSFSFQIYLAHSIWDWSDGNGRNKCVNNVNNTIDVTNMDMNMDVKPSGSKIDTHDDDHIHDKDEDRDCSITPPENGYYDNKTNTTTTWLHHSDIVLEHLVGIGDELSRFLSLPTSSRSYHRMLRSGREEAAEIVELQYKLFDSLYTKRITKLTKMAEQLKSLGLSATETSRIRQFERYIGEAVEGLRMIKMYRTPQALRSFGRMFTVLLPPLYAASFAQLAFDLQSLPMGILFAFITPLCLTALYESMTNLEDPFVGAITLDGIDCVEELEVLHWHQLKNARGEIFPDASPFEFRNPPGLGSINGEIYWQQPKQGDIFDTSSPLAPARMDGSLRMSHFARVRATSQITAESIDKSDRVSRFARDVSSRSRMRGMTAGVDHYVPRMEHSQKS